MVKQVRERANVSAAVIMKGRRQVASVHTFHGARVQVDVFAGDEKALKANCKAMGIEMPDARGDSDSWHDAQYQTGAAGGGGYDKATAALAGLYIDGHRMFDHCGRDGSLERLLARYQRDIDAEAKREDGDPGTVQAKYNRLAEKRGAKFANPRTYDAATGQDIRKFGQVWQTTDGQDLLNAQPYRCYASLFYLPGTDRLRALGYTVISAI